MGIDEVGRMSARAEMSRELPMSFYLLVGDVEHTYPKVLGERPP